jgi:hypothetical protein
MPRKPVTGPSSTGIDRASNALVQSDSRCFFQSPVQQGQTTCAGELKKALEILVFCALQSACTMVLLSIMKNCSIIVHIQAGILGRLKTPAHSIIRMRSTATRPRPASNAPHSHRKHDDGFFHKYQDMIMSLDQSRVIHAV